MYMLLCVAFVYSVCGGPEIGDAHYVCVFAHGGPWVQTGEKVSELCFCGTISRDEIQASNSEFRAFRFVASGWFEFPIGEVQGAEGQCGGVSFVGAKGTLAFSVTQIPPRKNVPCGLLVRDDQDGFCTTGATRKCL